MSNTLSKMPNKEIVNSPAVAEEIKNVLIHACKIGEYHLDSFKIDTDYKFELYTKEEKEYKLPITADDLLEWLISKCRKFCKAIRTSGYHAIADNHLESSLVFHYDDTQQKINLFIKEKSSLDYLFLSKIYFKFDM